MPSEIYSLWSVDSVKESGTVHKTNVLAPSPQDYSTEGMTASQLEFIQSLRQFGLVYQRKVGLWCNTWLHTTTEAV